MKVLAVLFLLLALALADQALRCGQVFDGLNLDVDEFSATKFKASWVGFEDGKEKNRVVRYEWAIISSDQITEAVTARDCRIAAGFRGLPVYGWQNVGTATVAVGTPSLQTGKTYYTIVRATTALGQQKYMNSDGFTVTEPKAELKKKSTENSKKVTRDEPSEESAECPIDQAWACAAAQVSIRERLDAVYGPASGQFLPFNLASATAFVVIPLGDLGTEDEPENHNGGGHHGASLNVGTIIGIGIGITAFFCLLTIGAIIIASFTGKGLAGDGNVRQHQNIEEF